MITRQQLATEIFEFGLDFVDMVNNHGYSADLIIGLFPKQEYMSYFVTSLHKYEIFVLLGLVFALIVGI